MGRRLATSKQKYLLWLLGILFLAGLIALLVYKAYDKKIKNIEHTIQQLAVFSEQWAVNSWQSQFSVSNRQFE